MEEDLLKQFLTSDNVIVALLSSIVVVLSSVVVYQWFHTMRNTVPKYVWDRLVDKVDELLKAQTTTLLIIKERLK